MSNFELTARVLPEPMVPPSAAALPKRLRVEITDRNGVLISELPSRSEVSFTEPLNDVGTGQLTIPKSDPILNAYPTLLDYGNIIKFWLGDVCVSGVRIKQKTVIFSSSSENAGINIQVSGPTVHHMLADFIVKHDGNPRPTSGTTREYSWASKPGEWYNADDWDHNVREWTLRNPPTAAKKHNPKHWRVPSAKWIGFSGGWKYFRKNFNVAEEGTHVRIYASADEGFSLYLDGEQILTDEHVEIGYRTYVHSDQVLGQGQHTIAVQTRTVPSPNGDGRDNLLVAVCKVNYRNRRILPPLLVSNHTWKAHKGNPPPGWNRAQVLRSMVTEARARGVDAANALTFGFTGSADTGGSPWADRFGDAVDIGTTVLDAQAQLSEGGNFDVWVDPADLTLKAWNVRGVNRSASVALMPGVNLLDYETTETDEVLNVALIQFEGGWTETSLSSSIDRYGRRETYAELGNIHNPTTAITAMNQALRGIGRTNKQAGTTDVKSALDSVPKGSIVPVEGMFPMIDWSTGDIISAYNSDANLVPHRVMSLTCTEDESGNLTFDSELEEVDRMI